MLATGMSNGTRTERGWVVRDPLTGRVVTAVYPCPDTGRIHLMDGEGTPHRFTSEYEADAAARVMGFGWAVGSA